ncbi:MAG: hypothetical protein A2X49_09970 [Lentisphaerae bacterium GWF2_52_8]|nr:MAG: hypothetical protein A2X49_09970 [Lentisphaerae bacterium GWF2_52_8]
MKAGDSFDCPHCGRNSFLKKGSQMDGWKKVADILACASCSAKIATLAAPEATAKPNSSASLDKLASILGAEREEKPKIKAKGSEKNFCKDCRHLIIHPFLYRCSKHNKDVNPMDDCPDFVRRPTEAEEKK